MKKTIIIDFMGVVADTDYFKLISSFPLTEKYRALRVLVALKTKPEIKSIFSEYQKGLIDVEKLESAFSRFYPKQAYMVPIILSKLNDYTKINFDVLEMVQNIRNKGNQVILMSNATPEVVELIRENGVADYFDGVILSNELKMKKPLPEIYEYAINTYKIDPLYSIMIDDSQKNLNTADKYGITTMQSKNSTETYSILSELVDVLDCVF